MDCWPYFCRSNVKLTHLQWNECLQGESLQQGWRTAAILPVGSIRFARLVTVNVISTINVTNYLGCNISFKPATVLMISAKFEIRNQHLPLPVINLFYLTVITIWCERHYTKVCFVPSQNLVLLLNHSNYMKTHPTRGATV